MIVLFLFSSTSCEEESSVPVTQLSPTTTSLSASTVTDETTSAGQLLWLSSGLPICRSFPGLSKEQLDLCHRHPEITSAAVQGLQLAVHECQFQFQWNRWNCSSLNTKNRNPHSSVLLKRGKYTNLNFSLTSRVFENICLLPCFMLSCYRTIEIELTLF